MDPSQVSRRIPANPQQLYEIRAEDSSMVYQPTTEIMPDQSDGGVRPLSRSKACLSYGSLAILCFVNLINYMDRFTVAGVLKSIRDYYHLTHGQLGFLQTCFIISYMLFAPAFGYLGDRFSRKFLMSIGITFWSMTTLAGSFVPHTQAWLFYLLRALVGIGEASYSTLAPTVIADLFPRSQRTTMLSIFYFAIPVGSGLGYLIGTQVASAFGAWQWALRVTPVLGLTSVIFILLFLHEPSRGSSDGHVSVSSSTDRDHFVNDLKYILTVPTYIWTSVGFTCVCFTVGAISWWAPYYMLHAYEINDPSTPKTEDDIGRIFGIITALAGIFGVIAGSGGAYWYRRYNPRADPLVCGIGMFVGVPFTFLGLITAHKIPALSWFMIALGITSLCTNWALVADILLYVIVPNKRATAQAFQILISHLLGDATSPVIIGSLSRAFGNGTDDDDSDMASAYFGLMYAFFTSLFILVLGGAAFLYSSTFIVQDVERCKNMSSNDDASTSYRQVPQEHLMESLPPHPRLVFREEPDEALSEPPNKSFVVQNFPSSSPHGGDKDFLLA